MFSNENEFSLHIETLAATGSLTYVDAILNFCEEKDIDVEEITSLINKSLKEKIAKEVKFGPLKAQLEDDCISF